MSESTKAPPGLFRLKDLEAMEVEDQPLFPGAEEDRSGFVSEVAAEEMVAAIRRARETHSQEHDPRELGAEVSGIYSLLVTDERAGAAPPAPDDEDETGDFSLVDTDSGEVPPVEQVAAEAAGASGPHARALHRTAQSHAVIKAAHAERSKRSRGAVLLMVGLPLLLVVVTATVLALVLLSREPHLSDDRFPIRAAAVSEPDSQLAGIGLMAIPEPEPEPELEPEPAPEPAQERRERRERRPRETEPVIDRSDLF
jgi:hypothetical protein